MPGAEARLEPVEADQRLRRAESGGPLALFKRACRGRGCAGLGSAYVKVGEAGGEAGASRAPDDAAGGGGGGAVRLVVPLALTLGTDTVLAATRAGGSSDEVRGKEAAEKEVVVVVVVEGEEAEARAAVR